MDVTPQLWKNRKELLTLGYKEADVVEAFERIRLQHLQYYDLRKRVETCKDCPLSDTCKSVAGAQFVNGPVMIIGDAPTKEDAAAGIPFAGIEGYILTIILNKLNVNRDQLYLTNVVKCNKEKVSLKDTGLCMHHLFNEIAIIEPSVIITLGDVPYQLLAKKKTKLLEARGEWFEESYTPLQINVMPTHHPRDLMQLTGKALVKAKKEIWADLTKAFKQVQLI